MEISLANEILTLLPEKAAFWAARQTLLIADPHFGKAAAFRLAGLFVPRGTTRLALQRIDSLLDQTGATRLVFLGDFLHARRGRSSQVLGELAEWRNSRSTLEIILVRGNHDRGAGDPPPETQITCVNPPYIDGPFAFAHHPEPVAGSYVLAGHIHPCVALHGPRGHSERLPCFWFGREVGVLPAFGEFTGCAQVRPCAGDRVVVVGGGELVDAGVNS